MKCVEHYKIAKMFRLCVNKFGNLWFVYSFGVSSKYRGGSY